MLVTVFRCVLVSAVFAISATLIGTTAVFAQQGGFSQADKDGDGKIDRSELEAYASSRLDGFDRWDELMQAIDRDGDGSISKQEFGNRMDALQRVMRRTRRGERSGEMQDRRRRSGREREEPGALKVGDVAPLFKLKSLDGKSEFELAEYRGKKPVVLIFGSYT